MLLSAMRPSLFVQHGNKYYEKREAQWSEPGLLGLGGGRPAKRQQPACAFGDGGGGGVCAAGFVVH